MSKALEKAEARLKKLQDEADRKRMKSGFDQVKAGLKILSDSFHNQEYTNAASMLFDMSDRPLADIEALLK